HTTDVFRTPCYLAAMTEAKPVLLVVLDGWGVAPPGPGNAITAARPAFFNSLWRNHPHTTLHACGEEVGLPAGQFGKSEVRHLNLGGGRVVFQDSARIDRDSREGSFARNAALQKALQAANPADPRGGRIHLIGSVGEGGVHSMDRHHF